MNINKKFEDIRLDVAGIEYKNTLIYPLSYSWISIKTNLNVSLNFTYGKRNSI